ncbi:MAG: peptidoglycan DD-metalloendopeptidase family protein [gamma proteobacterium symbiont of Bathyaustriella thionipta]|nr:peptidoglycan DD-metalloendopeptidase family protein [gamma proteobacterium symbiont of Bathyaustriella thionipta]MCU7951003.1 peptidoglycan DD-metalloendopeptidase family protein [gamma proteobacterium symbiont of Bathyaustriella thionipta]MCU7951844.1 peptidoglycan DD-metalloendopeptidase family protein [gamma proteobacterium symbiont of Bathyaustriella thionipta]MCU7957510.1 peptidoglycan DD-metalloendopeptidase family protein [gamma proteobacterium symbiont of Bathyaustriella thionipta]M
MQGCSSTYAPVENRRAASYDVKKKYTGKTPAYHRVKQGDTLYSIAWSYGQDYKSIAYRNNIKPPYRIFVGDALRLTTTQSSYGTKSRVNSAYKKRTTSQHSKKGIVKSTPNKKTQSKKTTTNSSRYSGSKQLYWNWPVKGKVIQRYLPQKGKKGIDISAAKGTLIKSAEAGKVVYSGQGLVGYGRLIIIKHNDIFLSAYAHNQNLLVNEGQLVKKGQNIARLGRSGTDRYKLHFEIRKHGKPVNPMSYLPH